MRQQEVSTLSHSSEADEIITLQNQLDGFWDWDLKTDEVYYSPRWKSMLGYAESDLSNNLNTWATLVHQDEKDAILEKVKSYLSGESESFDVEMQMKHKDGHYIYVLSRAFVKNCPIENKPIRLLGTHVDITDRKEAEIFNEKTANILRMIAKGTAAAAVYDAIALLYESRHAGMRCSLLELENGILLHGGAPSMPKEYCDAVHGLKIGPHVGSCGTSTFTGEQCLVEDISTHPNWSEIKDFALPHGLRSCWSEPIKCSSGKVLGAFGMYYNHPGLPNEKELNDLQSASRLAGIVMERDQNQKLIHELAYMDDLTGIPNRANFYKHINELIEQSKLNKSTFSLLSIDLDDFKNVNDSLGHDIGDMLLKTIAKRMRSIAHKNDFIGRLSGDEFCIIVNEYAEVMAERCLKQIAHPVELSGRTFTPSCSIGIAHYPADGQDVATLVKAADTSLYSAKEHGKNKFAFYHPNLTKMANHRFKIEQCLRQSIENKELTLVYQPQIELNTGKIVGVEALSRWHHPQLGHVLPTEFIATAEKIGLIKQLTENVLLTACRQAVSWKQSSSALRMSVNISPSHFLEDDFVPFIKNIIQETGINPSNLELEVTENIVQTEAQNLPNFKQLSELGIMISIDDFGTGYSSFASLKHLTANFLKIDQYFIQDMTLEKETKELVKSMIEIGHNLKHGIIAEGIETIEQLNTLKALGCEIGQGYFFSKPVTADEVQNILNKGIVK